MRPVFRTIENSLDYIVLLVVFTLPYACIWVLLPKFRRNVNQITKESGSLQAENKIILFWTGYFGGVFPQIRQGLRHCPTQRCSLSDHREDLSVASAVVFHAPDLNAVDLPQNRSVTQSYVFHSLESPIYAGNANDAKWRQFFNLTWTYRLDSDVPDFSYFSQWSVKKWERNYTTLEFLRNKNKRAMALISRCGSSGNREALILEIRKYLPVDVFGNCGEHACTMWNPECETKLIGNYSFYLAFENSHCKDYLTEKALRGYNYGAIPVVYGAGNYTKFFPKNSFIDVSEFASVEHLGLYLRNLTSSHKMYETLHEWHFDETIRHPVEREASGGICRLCELLHEPNFHRTSQVVDLHRWWLAMGNCTSFKV